MINIKYKEKYLKYKYKYLELKTKLGGVKFNSDLTLCVDNDDYMHYDAMENKCCKEKEFKDCTRPLPHTIDHSQIPSESSLNKNVYEFNKDIPYLGHDPDIKHNKMSFEIEKDEKKYNLLVCKTFTTNSGLNYEINKELSRGANGIVIQYHDSKYNKYIAVKYGFIDNDIVVINKIEQNKSCSDLVVGCVIYEFNYNSNKYYCIIMENAIGTLKDLIPIINSDKNILVDILYAVAIAIKCLQKINLYYTDIKYQNIFFRNTANNGIQIILGDLGSASELEMAPTLTYFPYELYLFRENIENSKSKYYKKNPYDTNDQQLKCIIAWGFGILIFKLLNINVEDLNPINPYTYNLLNNDFIDPTVYIHNLVKDKFNPKIPPEYHNIISNTVGSNDYKKRLNIDEIIDGLNIIRKKTSLFLL